MDALAEMMDVLEITVVSFCLSCCSAAETDAVSAKICKEKGMPSGIPE